MHACNLTIVHTYTHTHAHTHMHAYSLGQLTNLVSLLLNNNALSSTIPCSFTYRYLHKDTRAQSHPHTSTRNTNAQFNIPYFSPSPLPLAPQFSGMTMLYLYRYASFLSNMLQNSTCSYQHCHMHANYMQLHKLMHSRTPTHSYTHTHTVTLSLANCPLISAT